jgi:hypothetical protein
MALLDEFLNGVVLGVHLISAHSAPGLNDDNPGLYVRTNGGLTAGFYENSLSRTHVNGNDGSRRVSRYLGWTWETSGRGLALTLGAVDGYGQDAVDRCVPNTAPPIAKRSSKLQPAETFGCSYYEHQPKVRDVLPLAALSGRVPLGADWAARMGYVYVPALAEGGKRMHTANLMLEFRFR